MFSRLILVLLPIAVIVGCWVAAIWVNFPVGDLQVNDHTVIEGNDIDAREVVEGIIAIDTYPDRLQEAVNAANGN